MLSARSPMCSWLALVVTSAVLVAIRSPDAWILVLALALYPFLYAAFPTSWFWNDGRYGLSLTPILSLVIAGGLWQMARPKIAVWARFCASCPRLRFDIGGIQ